ncbi:hypothetical protein D0N36_09875 [Hymenobacter lapidiphilus]|uniref:hypothetical protein n=1 Tax=Hymenobacter sp. CCM 8763 TaxID=2303334 RepID=UPI000E34C6A0|nr:hypothetical protein [Hymenobacter sp. CCM 8763]RFP65167.1 hypothetical protein D0N36_09875 [Hymenobacter sp. CCM 8763]
MLSDTALTTDYLHLSYCPKMATLVVRWLRAVSFAEVQEGLRAAREMSYSYGAARWLVDVRRRTELDAATSGWVATTLLPAVAAESAPAMLHIAYLLSPTRADMLEHSPGMRAVTATAQAHPAYQLQLFLDEAVAVAWLMS